MGYQEGLTMHALPYDWRKGIVHGNAKDVLGKVLERSLEITGKKAIITAHSLGTLESLYYLSTTD